MIIRTEAIVLRAIDYSETSKIVTLFTRANGRVTVMAKGARSIKSRFGSTLQPMSFTQVVYYHKPERDIQTLSESSHVQSFLSIATDLDRLRIGLECVELVNATHQTDHPNREVFELLREVLEALSANEGLVLNLSMFFRLQLARILGFSPSFTKEAIEAIPAHGAALDLRNGDVQERPSGEWTRQAGRTALRAFAVAARTDLPTVLKMAVTPAAVEEADALVSAYLRYHLDASYPGRSRSVFKEMKSGK